MVFRAARLCVFCDGDFWHGRNWPTLRRQLEQRHNSAYWVEKIDSNRRRDRRLTKLLEASGWRVLRVWETDILKDVSAAGRSVCAAIASAPQ